MCVWGGGGDFYLLHRITQLFGGHNFEIYYFWGFGTFPTILGYIPFLTGIFSGVSFQDKAFDNVFLIYSLIKCSMFTIYASNLLESIKILYFEFNKIKFPF